MSGPWQLWLTSAVIAALVTGLVNMPKMLADRRKTNAETDGERFDTYKETTDATIGELKSSCARCNTQLELVVDVLRKWLAAYDSRDQTSVAAAVSAARKLI